MPKRLGFLPPRRRHHLVENRDGNGKPDGTYHCETCRAEKEQKRASVEGRS